MGRRRNLTLCGLLVLCLLAAPGAAFGETATGPAISGPEQEADMPDLAVAAKGAVLLDAGSGTVLYEQNAYEELPPASITKIMTMLLVLEAEDAGKITLEDPVTISERAAGMGGSQMYMEPGETHTIDELLMGMAMASANDACVAVAEYVGGTEEIFVEMMNSRAAELGMEHTHFVNTNGLPAADHYSCACDIAVMSRELLKHEEIAGHLTTWMAELNVGLPGKETSFGLTNTNRLIKRYSGATGVKTGFTQDAGYCLSGSAAKGDLSLIAVVLGCESTEIRWTETMRLLDYGFATYAGVSVAEAGDLLGTVAVEKSDPDQITVAVEEEVKVLVKKGEENSVTWEARFFDGLQAPLAEGEPVGELVLFQNGEETERRQLVAAEAAERAGLPELYRRLLHTLV
ncbi:MAG: D-alanyl-D-alanine carboxypeptidase family protein [Bacillota bacterium]|nr:D-alanyl-D-alanine carboxypeptidase family protein [Bacillota bacterium]